MNAQPIVIATRGSALALAQANQTLAACRRQFPALEFEIKIIKTTGDKLQAVSLSKADASLPKGLFTKELETALLNGGADLAVHSLKDLPTELPAGLALGGVAGQREDVRDVLLYKAPLKPLARLADLTAGLTVGSSSPRRSVQLLALRPDFKMVEIRGNVPTRLRKLAAPDGMDATLLAAAGLARLGFHISKNGTLTGNDAPPELLAMILETSKMLPCVGQGAIGLEIREGDERMAAICQKLNHEPTLHCVTAERSFLRAMGGGCQAPIGAHAAIVNNKIQLKVVSFMGRDARRAEGEAPVAGAAALGERLARELGIKP